MNAYNKARTTLFRAMLGEDPIPSAEEVVQARALLNNDPEFRAGLDELVSVVLLEKLPETEHWRDRLQAYVAAQLVGQPSLAEFAELRQQLDANVALSEEYALLYETMAHEQQGTLPIPLDVPPLKLDFLPATQVPSPPAHKLAGLQPLKRLKLNFSGAFAWLQLFRLDQLYPWAAALLLCIVLMFGVWRIAHRTDSDRTTNHMENRQQPSAFFKLQMQIETSSPTNMTIQFYETPEVVSECPQMRQSSFARNICKT